MAPLAASGTYSEGRITRSVAPEPIYPLLYVFRRAARSFGTTHSLATSRAVGGLRALQPGQRTARTLHRLPGIGPALQPVPDAADRDPVGPQAIAFHLRPFQGHGDRRAPPRPDGVGRDRGLGVGVAVDVDEQSPATSLLDELGGQMTGIARRHLLRDRIGEEVGLFEAHRDCDRE